MLTSALKRVDPAVFLTIKCVVDGTLAGRPQRDFGLKQDGVGLGKISPEVPAGRDRGRRRSAKKIADGEISDIPTTVP